MVADGKIATRHMGLCDHCGGEIENRDMYHIIGKEKLHQRCVEARVKSWGGGGETARATNPDV